MVTTNAGIDYGCGTTNRDKKTGIHYGVISPNEVGQAWYDSAKTDYGDATCPHCGEMLTEIGNENNKCTKCRKEFYDGEQWSDEPNGYFLDDGEYIAEQGRDGDIFITRSPFYTRCQYCSPCAPRAGYILNEVKDGIKAYCFNHDWFDGNKAPYKVYRVEDDTEVLLEGGS